MLWLAVAFLVYLGVLLAAAWAFLHPYRLPIYLSPGAMGAPQEEVAFETDDGLRLTGWWVGREGSDKVAVLAHGFMMNRCELTPLAVTLWGWGFSCLVFDFRAHGRSAKAKCGLGRRERADVRAAVRFARSRVPGARVLLAGSSMGAAACAFAMAEDPALAEAAVLDSCYGRLSAAVAGWWRFLGGRFLQALMWPGVYLAWPLAGFNPLRVDAAKALPAIPPEKLLFIHGTGDLLALPSEAERNLAACPGARLVWLEGCGHSEGRWLRPDAYHGALRAFLAERQLLDP